LQDHPFARDIDQGIGGTEVDTHISRQRKSIKNTHEPIRPQTYEVSQKQRNYLAVKTMWTTLSGAIPNG
jgi:hypothetical protein